MDKDERLKVAYDGALKMISYEGGIIWSAFRSVLAANTALLESVSKLMIKGLRRSFDSIRR